MEQLAGKARFFAIVHAARNYTNGTREHVQACRILCDDQTDKHARRAIAHASRMIDHGYTRLLIDLHQQITLSEFHQFTKNLDAIAKSAAEKE